MRYFDVNISIKLKLILTSHLLLNNFKDFFLQIFSGSLK